MWHVDSMYPNYQVPLVEYMNLVFEYARASQGMVNDPQRDVFMWLQNKGNLRETFFLVMNMFIYLKQQSMQFCTF